MKKAKIGSLDFETHNGKREEQSGITSIWLGVVYFGDDDYKVVTTMDALFAYFESVVKKDKKKVNHILYIHNLAFESSFILPWLLSNGYAYDNETLKAKTYSILTTSSLSVVYNMKIRIKVTGGLIELRDSARLYMTSLARLAKSLGLPDKGGIDYQAERPLVGYVPTEQEISYCVNDCRIIYLAVMKSLADETLGKFFKSSLTAGAFAVKTAIGKYGYPKSYRPMRVFREDYPELSEEENAFAHNALSGGITWINPDYQFVKVENYHHIDIHSAHPAQAYYGYFPFKTGRYGLGKPPLNPKCHIIHIKYSYDDIIVPCFIATKDLRFVSEAEAYVYDFEIALAKKCYVNFRVDEYIDYYEYSVKRLKWRNFYLDAFSKKAAAKVSGDKYVETINKLFLNAGGYGKFVEGGHSEEIIPFIDEEDGIVKTIKKERTDARLTGKYTYYPMGAMIPALTRFQLVTTALKIIEHGGKVLYFDTDSIFFKGADDFEQFIDVGDNLGQWSIESDHKEIEFYVPKRYIYKEEDVFASKAGGFNGIIVNDVEDFHTIKGFEVLSRRKVKGGTLLTLKSKELKVPDKYAIIYERNRVEKNDT